MFKKILILLSIFSSFDTLKSFNPCETCISLVSMDDILENKIKYATVNTTRDIIEFTCNKCPVMDKDMCVKVIDSIDTIFENCRDNKILCPYTSCTNLGVCKL